MESSTESKNYAKRYRQKLKSDSLRLEISRERARERAARYRKKLVQSKENKMDKVKERMDKVKEQNRKRQQQFRLKKNNEAKNKVSPPVNQPYKCKQTLGKAVCKAKRALPVDPEKRAHIVDILYGKYGTSSSKQQSESATTDKKQFIKDFYLRDDISIQAPAENDAMGCIEILATTISIILMVITFPISVFICFKVVSEYERAVIFRMGRLRCGGARGPGVFFVLPCVDDYCKVDLRTVSFDVPPQEVLSKDSVTVTVDAVVYYRISDPLKAVIQVSNYSHSTRLLAATTLRNVLGTRNLSELLTERETISHTMQVSLDEATDPWGVKVERVEIKDVSLPTALQRAMAAEAEAAREARAKVIAAEGEMKSSRALKEASEILSSSPSALQLRYLQTLNNISAEKNSTIIFPLPMELLTPFLSNHHSAHCTHKHQ